jgi:hypothetical protein
MENQYLEFMRTPQMLEALAGSSVSMEDAMSRSKEYAKMFSRNEEMMNNIFGMGQNSNLLQKTFSGYAETPLLSTQYFNASVASYVSSFAGYMSIERDFEQPNGLFYWFDVLGITDLRTVVPNLGPDSYQDINTTGSFSTSFTVTANPSYTTITGRKIVPGTVRVKVAIVNATGTVVARHELIDNGQGKFMAVPGVIAGDGPTENINYLNGSITFKLGDLVMSGTSHEEGGSSVSDHNGLTENVANSRIEAIGKEDVTGTPTNTNGATNTHANDKRFIAKMQQLGLSTVPDMLVAEYNIAALGALKKATGSDMATFLFTKLRELYTKCINYKLVSTLEEGYTGNDMMSDLDLSVAQMKEQFHDYRSRVDLFDSYLINVEANLAAKATKSVFVTAYVAGNQASNQFAKGGMIGKWEPNTKMTYINDLLGWYNGIPVLRSTDIQENQGSSIGTFYAIIKTQDGQMAPLARGIYMPLTDTPTVGNYNNPTQMASGIYYQEGVKYLAPELVQKVSFKYGI